MEAEIRAQIPGIDQLISEYASVSSIHFIIPYQLLVHLYTCTLYILDIPNSESYVERMLMPSRAI